MKRTWNKSLFMLENSRENVYISLKLTWDIVNQNYDLSMRVTCLNASLIVILSVSLWSLISPNSLNYMPWSFDQMKEGMEESRFVLEFSLEGDCISLKRVFQTAHHVFVRMLAHALVIFPANYSCKGMTLEPYISPTTQPK